MKYLLERIYYQRLFYKFVAINRKYKRFNDVQKFIVLNENKKETEFDKHYVYHIAWALRKLKELSPSYHIDISSSLYFSIAASTFCSVKFFDYRPPQLFLDNLDVNQCDLINLFFEDNSIQSLSCMHVIEHIGLGRYGEPIDYFGDLKAIAELKRVLAKGGKLMFVVPIGNKSKLCFNAHRIYTFEQIKDLFKELKLLNFTFITSKFDGTGLIDNPNSSVLKNEHYGCGCFLFEK